MTKRPTALITGASTGIGATYADRLARRGHDLVLVARDRDRLEAVAARLRAETGRDIEVMPADLTDEGALSRIETRLGEDEAIGLLINTAGAAQHGGFVGGDPREIDRLIRLNIQALTRLTVAAIPRLLARGDGAIVNIASVVALAPEIPFGVYGATKSYVLAFSQSLQEELGARLYVQAVLPGATRTEIWERSGRDVNALQSAMSVDDLVDAALVGFDRREPVTIPPLQDAGLWEAFAAARKAMLPDVMQPRPAERYRVAAS